MYYKRIKLILAYYPPDFLFEPKFAMTENRIIALGTLINSRYLIERKIGEGGFAVTYLAFDQKNNDFCVVKQLKTGSYSNEEEKKRIELFEREAKVLSRLSHRQIPEFRETLRENNNFFLVQGYVEGKSYEDLIEERQEKREVFSEKEIIKFLLQLLPVLEYIHKNELIHRDISPDNIIYYKNLEKPVLIDFGAVKSFSQTELKNGKALTMIMKNGYSPPEQMMYGKCSQSSDIYALAATVLRLLTGKKPGDLIDPQTMEWQWKEEIQVSKHLEAILERMLAPRPEGRYQTATEVLKELSRYSQNIEETVTIPAIEPKKNYHFLGITLTSVTILIIGSVLLFNNRLFCAVFGCEVNNIDKPQPSVTPTTEPPLWKGGKNN